MEIGETKIINGIKVERTSLYTYYFNGKPIRFCSKFSRPLVKQYGDTGVAERIAEYMIKGNIDCPRQAAYHLLKKDPEFRLGRCLVCGKRNAFKNLSIGYMYKNCSNHCRWYYYKYIKTDKCHAEYARKGIFGFRNKKILEKAKATMKKRYGVEWGGMSSRIVRRARETYRDRVNKRLIVKTWFHMQIEKELWRAYRSEMWNDIRRNANLKRIMRVKKRKFPDEEVEEYILNASWWLELFEEGYTIKEIAKEAGISEKLARKIVKELGITEKKNRTPVKEKAEAIIDEEQLFGVF